MKESPGLWSPVAVFHSNTSCCMFGTVVSCWRWGRGLLWGPGHCGPWGNLSSDVLHSVPRVTSTLMADWTWSWVSVGLERVNRDILKGLPVAQHCCGSAPAVAWHCSAVLCTPLSVAVLKGLKEEVMALSCFGGEFYFSHGNCTFLLNPLHFDIHLVSSSTENGLARVGWAPWPNFAGELDAAVVNQGSLAVSGCGVKLNMGSLFPNALSGLPTRMCWL